MTEPSREVDHLTFGPMPPEVEQMRERMLRAPHYRDDFAERNSSELRYRFGVYPMSDTDDGLVIAEEIVPEVEVLGPEGKRNYSHSTPAQGDFMCANSLVGLKDRNIWPAIASLGFTAAAAETQPKGSRLITALCPSAERFNARMNTIEPHGIKVMLLPRDPDPSPEEVTRALAEGYTICTSELDMLMHVSMIGLLGPKVIDLLRHKAGFALAHPNTPMAGSLDKSSEGNYRHIQQSTIYGLSTVIFANKLIEALDDPFEGRVTPTTEEKLGFDLTRLVERPGLELGDLGLELAQDTVAHIRRLAARDS